jgi:hypothetical protein
VIGHPRWLGLAWLATLLLLAGAAPSHWPGPNSWAAGPPLRPGAALPSLRSLHEHVSGYDPYWRRMLGGRPAAWYSFQAGGWQLLSLDSEAPHDPGSAQYRWLQSQVRAPGTCRLAFWHRARYSAGAHHGDQDDPAPVWDALRGRTALVVAAHELDMQRFRPIDGITEFVAGSGGDGHYSINRRDRGLAFANDTDYGALRLNLRPGMACFAFVTADGRTVDGGTVRCRQLPA